MYWVEATLCVTYIVSRRTVQSNLLLNKMCYKVTQIYWSFWMHYVLHLYCNLFGYIHIRESNCLLQMPSRLQRWVIYLGHRAIGDTVCPSARGAISGTQCFCLSMYRYLWKACNQNRIVYMRTCVNRPANTAVNMLFSTVLNA